MKITIMKYGIVGLIILFLVGLYLSNSVKDIPGEKIAAFEISNVKELEVDRGNDRGLRKYYGIDAEDLEGYTLYIPNAIMSANELFIAKVNDKSKVAEIQSAIQNRIKEQKKSFNGYGTNQMDLLEHAEIETKGKYVFFAVSKDASEWKKQFEQLIL